MNLKKLLSVTLFYAAIFSAIIIIIAFPFLKYPLYGLAVWIFLTIPVWALFLSGVFLRYLFRDAIVNFVEKIKA